MGIAVQYCIFCQQQIPSKELADGRAIQRPGGYVCTECARKGGIATDDPPSRHATPAPRRPSVLAPVPSRVAGHPTPSRVSGHPTPQPRSSSHPTPPPSREPHASHVGHEGRVPRGPAASPNGPLVPVILGAIGIVLLVLVFVLFLPEERKQASSQEPVAAADPRIGQVQRALARAKEVDEKDYEEAIEAFRRAAAVFPESEWGREASRRANEVEAKRDAAAEAEFRDVKAKADEWETTGQFAGAREEWDHFPRRFLVGGWTSKVEEERKAIDGREAAFEAGAEAAAKDALRKAAVLADAKEWAKAIEALDAFPSRFKAAKAAEEVAKTKARYQEEAGPAVCAAAGGVAAADERCVERLLAGDLAGARGVWEALKGGPHDAAAKAQLVALADIEADREKDGVATWAHTTHLVVLPKDGQAWHGTCQGNILIRGTADLEGDGIREVLVGIDGHKADAGWVVCMGIEGTRRWYFKTGARHWQQDRISDEMNVVGVRIADLDGDGKKEVITVSNHVAYFPCRVCVLSWEGKLVSEYWNPGWGGQSYAGDLDGDGRPEVLIPFVNNDWDKVEAVACFHGTDIRGTAPPAGSDGSQMWYAKLPGAKAPMKGLTLRAKKKGDPVTRLECEFQDGTWVLGPDGQVIQKP